MQHLDMQAHLGRDCDSIGYKDSGHTIKNPSSDRNKHVIYLLCDCTDGKHYRLYALARGKQQQTHEHSNKNKAQYTMRCVQARARDDIQHGTYATTLAPGRRAANIYVSALYRQMYDRELYTHMSLLHRTVGPSNTKTDAATPSPVATPVGTTTSSEACKAGAGATNYSQNLPNNHVDITLPTQRGGGSNAAHKNANAQGSLVDASVLRSLNLHTEPQRDQQCGAIAVNVLLNRPIFTWECNYMYDMLAASARELGMTTIKVDETTRAIDELEAVLGIPLPRVTGD